MNLTGQDKELHDILKKISTDIGSKLIFEDMASNDSAINKILLSCSILRINPSLIGFREKREQAILQIDYICENNIAIHETNIKSIIKKFNIDLIFNSGVIVYQPTARSQWINKDSKRITVLSVYLQFDEVI